MMDLSKFEFFKKGKSGSHNAAATIVVYARGASSISAKIGETLGKNIDIGMTSDGLQMCIKNGKMFSVATAGKSYSGAKKFSSSKIVKHIDDCNIKFPATYSFVYTDGVWIGELQP